MIRVEGDRILADVHTVELPVTLRPQRRWTDEELFQFCRLNADLRIERRADGRISVMEPRGPLTGHRNAAITAALGVWTRQDGRGKSFDSSTGWTLPDGSMLSAGASWVSRPRWEALTQEEQERFAPLCPDFVVELMSPLDTLPAMREKMAIWLANGVELAWLIDPDARSVEVFRPEREREPELVIGTDRILADGPVAGFVLDLGLIWNE